MRQSATFAAVAVAAGAALWSAVPDTREAVARAQQNQPAMTAQFVDGFTNLKPILGDAATLAVWTDPPLPSLFGGKNMQVSGTYCLAQYALAPMVLVDAKDDDARVLLIASDAAGVQREAARRGARIIWSLAPFVALVERPSP